MAKEICLVAGASPRANEVLKAKSKAYRKYLIQFEERYKNNPYQDMYLTELKKVSDRLEKIESKINTPNQIEVNVNQVSDSDYKNNLRYGLAIQMNELNQKERELNGELIKIQEKKSEIRGIYAQL